MRKCFLPEAFMIKFKIADSAGPGYEKILSVPLARCNRDPSNDD